MIVAEFFDTGQSRVLPWQRRPQAAALVAQLADPDCGRDAIVIGEYERAGVLREPVRVDWHAEDHEQTMLALGLSSKREITRTRIRVRTAIAAQTREQWTASADAAAGERMAALIDAAMHCSRSSRSR